MEEAVSQDQILNRFKQEILKRTSMVILDATFDMVNQLDVFSNFAKANKYKVRELIFTEMVVRHNLVTYVFTTRIKTLSDFKETDQWWILFPVKMNINEMHVHIHVSVGWQ